MKNWLIFSLHMSFTTLLLPISLQLRELNQEFFKTKDQVACFSLQSANTPITFLITELSQINLN